MSRLGSRTFLLLPALAGMACHAGSPAVRPEPRVRTATPAAQAGPSAPGPTAVTVRAGQALSLEVRDTSGRPIPGATIRLLARRHDGGDSIAVSRSGDRSGRVPFPPLAEGQYTLQVVGAGAQPLRVSVEATKAGAAGAAFALGGAEADERPPAGEPVATGEAEIRGRFCGAPPAGSAPSVLAVGRRYQSPERSPDSGGHFSIPVPPRATYWVKGLRDGVVADSMVVSVSAGLGTDLARCLRLPR